MRGGPVKGTRFSRRSLLKWLAVGLAGTGTLLRGPVGSLIAEAFTARSSAPAGTHPQTGHVQDTTPQRTSSRLRRWAMVIDLRRCDGCQGVNKPPQCTEACIQGHFAPEPMQWIEVYEKGLPGGGTQFVPTPCQQCQNPPCVNVCPVAATFSTPEGVVLIDQLRCIGCRICMEACPYDRRFFNWGNPPQPPEALFMEYDPEHQSPAIRGTVMKCNFCTHLARAGRLPYCVQACPNRAIFYGDLEEDLATNGSEVVQLSRLLSDNSAFRLKEHLGTEPRVYYIQGHGEAVGRDPYKAGRKPTTWPWTTVVQGATSWRR